MTDCSSWVQALRANCNTIHDPAAAKYTKRIIQASQSLHICSVSAVRKKAISLQQAGRADELIWIPPERRTVCATASAKYAFVKAVQLFSFFGRLQALDNRWSCIVDQVRLNLFVLLVKYRHVYNKVANNWQTGKRT